MRLIDADALKREKRMADRCEDCERNARDCQYVYGYTLMDICSMLDDAPTIGDWISVKDRLPEKDGDYLARLRHGGMKVMGFTHDLRKVDDYQFKRKKPGWYEYDSEWGFCERNDITHYMPLPEPPKEEIECNTD